ncbi:hypothetical protein C6P74_15470 [Burkholderia multivorans]|nr:hypothetical protein C6P74_15470 [Burkholderia multivorans]
MTVVLCVHSDSPAPLSRSRNKARSGVRACFGRLRHGLWRGRRGPKRRAGFLEIRRDSNAKRGHSGTYPQGAIVGRGAGSARAGTGASTVKY